MEELLPGIFHWTSFHEGIRQDVHSYYCTGVEPAFLLDPRVPDDGLGWFEAHERPAHSYLTNRHHYRHSDRFATQFGTSVWCHRDGLHAFTHGEQVRPFDHGDALPGGVLALKVAALCPEETAFLIPLHGGILALGDSVVRAGDRLAFVPDDLMGDDPAGVKRGLREALGNHVAAHAFDHLLLAHGEPWIGGGKMGLRAFLRGR
ncbi:MAG: hypothetical protein M0037_07140 [Betaproteobacteria bacterium]|nr:hypothetical protein [Betaproteobacteria bacterium]